MSEIIKKDILSILSEVISILEVKEEKDVRELRELSNRTVHNSSIFQDEDSISIAIVVYSLSKVIERKENIDYKTIIYLLKNSKGCLLKDDVKGYRNNIKKTFNFISRIDSKLKLYVEELVEKSKIKKGSRIYEHGISLARVAELLGISEWELMSYVGKTQIIDAEKEKFDVRARLNFARNIFGIK